MRVAALIILAFFAPLVIGATLGERFTTYGGFHLGHGTLADVRAALGPAPMRESGDAGEYEVRLCYRTGQATVTYLSGEMGGAEHDLLGLSVATTSDADTVNCPRWPVARMEPPPRLAGLALGMSREAFERTVGTRVQRDGHVLRAFFSSTRKFTPSELAAMPAEVRAGITSGRDQGHMDVQISVGASFAHGRLTRFEVWQIESQ